VYSPAAVADMALLRAAGDGPWRKPEAPPWLEAATQGRALAMDAVPWDQLAGHAQNASPWSEGLGFMGYACLAELYQRPEYRRLSEIWAAECTRKWIRIRGGNPARIAALEASMRRHGIRERFREAIELDGGFGRAHLFLDFGDKPGERQDRLVLTPETVPPGSLKGVRVIEPFWCYPLAWDSRDPLAPDFYAPSRWQVTGDIVHDSRMLTIVGRQLPDVLKPVYLFGGLSLSQMAKPYIDNFIRNRTSVGNLLYSFSTMVLSTDLSAMLSGTGAKELRDRIETYALARDNGGLMVINRDDEDLKNVSAPLSGLDSLLAQAQEQIASVVGIPLVVLLGVTPSGLNASSDGELRAFYAHIRGYQEKVLHEPLNRLLRVLQLDLDGVVDESISYAFVDLWELDDEARARLRASDAQTDCSYLQAGVLDPGNVRNRLKHDQDSPYFGADLKPPQPPGQPGQNPRASDAGWDEDQHPRKTNGQFTWKGMGQTGALRPQTGGTTGQTPGGAGGAGGTGGAGGGTGAGGTTGAGGAGATTTGTRTPGTLPVPTGAVAPKVGTVLTPDAFVRGLPPDYQADLKRSKILTGDLAWFSKAPIRDGRNRGPFLKIMIVPKGAGTRFDPATGIISVEEDRYASADLLISSIAHEIGHAYRKYNTSSGLLAAHTPALFRQLMGREEAGAVWHAMTVTDQIYGIGKVRPGLFGNSGAGYIALYQKNGGSALPRTKLQPVLDRIAADFEREHPSDHPTLTYLDRWKTEYNNNAIAGNAAADKQNPGIIAYNEAKRKQTEEENRSRDSKHQIVFKPIPTLPTWVIWK
jgi:phage-related protein (TIGR01555 family)